jgi:hypothetical protein
MNVAMAGCMDKKQQRSGDFSQDPGFDPEQLFLVVGREENTARVSEAMCVFLERGERAAFARAVATFVRSARARNDPIERVLAVLIELATEHEGSARPHDLELSELRRLILHGVLLAFYGDSSVRVDPGQEP